MLEGKYTLREVNKLSKIQCAYQHRQDQNTVSTCVRLVFDSKSQWNLFEDLETLQNKRCRLLVSLQSDYQETEWRCMLQVPTTVLGNHGLYCGAKFWPLTSESLTCT